jgi:phosphatidate cytidylyltransferase
LVASLLGLILGGAPAKRTVAWAIGAAAVAYIAGLGLHFILIRDTSQGLAWTLLACAVTWSTDIGAFFTGLRFGKTPFFRAISPKKTLEGAGGGLAAGMLAAVIVVAAGGLHVPAAAVSASAQAGDLVESLVKREAGTKDSGTLIPGHGGVLDRIDSLLFAVTVTYYLRLLFS